MISEEVSGLFHIRFVATDHSGDLARQSRTLFRQYFPQNRSFLSQMYCRDLEVVYAYHATLFQVMSINCIHSVRVCEFQLNTEDLLLKD